MDGATARLLEWRHPLLLGVALPSDHVERAAVLLRHAGRGERKADRKGRHERPHALRHLTSCSTVSGGWISYASASCQLTWTRAPGSGAALVSCLTIVSRSPASVSTRIRVNAPTNTTSATVAGSPWPLSSMRSGRTEKRRPLRSRLFDAPTKPATNSLALRA